MAVSSVSNLSSTEASRREIAGDFLTLAQKDYIHSRSVLARAIRQAHTYGWDVGEIAVFLGETPHEVGRIVRAE